MRLIISEFILPNWELTLNRFGELTDGCKCVAFDFVVQRLMVRCDDCESVGNCEEKEKKQRAEIFIVYRTDSNTHHTVTDITIRLTELHL